MKKTTKKNRLLITENRVITWVSLIMQYLFLLTFLTTFFAIVKNFEGKFLLILFLSIWQSFYWWKLKIEWHKYLTDSYIKVYENNPMNQLNRGQWRKAKRYFEKNPIKL